MTTIFVDPGQWDRDALSLEGAPFHHLFRVRRLAVGDDLRVADGKGRVRSGAVEEVQRDRAEIRLGEELLSLEPSLDIHLLVATPKKARAEWLVEKATELGVSSIRFLRCERGPRTLGGGALSRLNRIALSAAAQSDRSVVPAVGGMIDWSEIQGVVDWNSALVLDASGETRFPEFSEPAGQQLCLLVGPEGGWSPGELEQLVAYGAVPLSLGERPLRIETAALVAVARCGQRH